MKEKKAQVVWCVVHSHKFGQAVFIFATQKKCKEFFNYFMKNESYDDADYVEIHKKEVYHEITRQNFNLLTEKS